ncbi:39S ribosomal protein L41, mitochondrial-like [Paramacrobiotus metropolitanus]|uniref:39S ribosomal protein L41, mitochondrial-like n=1 Tax=Paramacrobiotus metropolitanus TaxID=2943436 RepID=UPI0024462694|nr:39S ribosomal protein L41, mitochondrial-like [Paramacrobiotus metropolitanus]
MNCMRITAIKASPSLSHCAKATSSGARCLSTTCPAQSRNNPRSRPITVLDLPKHLQKLFKGVPEYEYPFGLYGYDVRPTGVLDASTGKFREIPEMIPELVIPDLTDFPLKAYVSYRAQDTVEPEHSARDLYDAIYGVKLAKDFGEGKIEDLVSETMERAELGLLRKHTYDLEPPRMLDTSVVPVTEKI